MWNSLIDCSWFHCCETESKLKCLSSKDFKYQQKDENVPLVASLHCTAPRAASPAPSSAHAPSPASLSQPKNVKLHLVSSSACLSRDGQLYKFSCIKSTIKRLDAMASPVPNWAYSLSDFLFDFMFPWFEDAIDPFLYQQLDSLLCLFFDHLKEAIGIHTYRQQT